MNRTIKDYVSGTTYNKYDIVVNNNITYQSLINGELTEPGTWGSWIVVKYGKQYSSTTKYNKGDVVVSNWNIYFTIADTVVGIEPSTNKTKFSQIWAEEIALRQLTWTLVWDTDLGLFPGTLIPDNSDLKTILTILENAIEWSSKSKQTVVANITDRDALVTPTDGDIAYVVDATGDLTVTL